MRTADLERVVRGAREQDGLARQAEQRGHLGPVRRPAVGINASDGCSLCDGWRSDLGHSESKGFRVFLDALGSFINANTVYVRVCTVGALS